MSEEIEAKATLHYARVPQRRSFWDRFPERRSRRQRTIDWVFGIVMPIFCVLADPLVFRGEAILGGFRTLAYCTMSVELAALLLWLLVGRWSGPLRGVFAGILLVGAATALLIGLVLLPFSFFGLLAFIGSLGFTPFLTAYVYIGNGVQAIRQIRASDKLNRHIPLVVTGVVLVAIVMFLSGIALPRRIKTAVDTIRHGDPNAVPAAITTLRHWRWCADYDGLVWAYDCESDSEAQMRIANAYRQITGADIEVRLMKLED